MSVPRSPPGHRAIHLWWPILAVALAVLLAAGGGLAFWNARAAGNIRTIQRFGGRITAWQKSPQVPMEVYNTFEAYGWPLPQALFRPLRVVIDHPHLTAIDAAVLAPAVAAAGVDHLAIEGGRIDDLTLLVRDAGLRGLSLHQVERTPGRLAGLTGATSLVSLSLSGTDVTDADLTPLAGLPRLAFLSLDGTAVTDAVVPTLEAMPSLREVSLSGTAVSETELQALADRKPGFSFSND